MAKITECSRACSRRSRSADRGTLRYQASPPHVSGARGAYVQQQHIACTPVGCLLVPRGGYPAGGKTFDGAVRVDGVL